MADGPTPRVSDDVIEAPSPTDERPACRICLQPASADAALVELGCRCVDAFVHDACAQRWYAMRGSNVCEVCKVSTELDVSSRDEFVAFSHQHHHLLTVLPSVLAVLLAGEVTKWWC